MAAVVSIAKVNRNRFLGRSRRRVDNRAKVMGEQIQRWMLKYGRIVIEEELRTGKMLFQKQQNGAEQLSGELLSILQNFGVQQYMDAGQEAAESVRAPWLVKPQALQGVLQAKEIRLQNILAETEQEVRRNMQSLINDAMLEDPRPSANEISRRIRNTFAGPGQTGRGATDEDQKRGWVFSPERAELIARTELVQSENTAIVDAYDSAGIEELEWVAYTSDRRSGDRQHWKMNGKTVQRGERFKTPLGNYLRYPGDPMASIKETANCRCTVVAVI